MSREWRRLLVAAGMLVVGFALCAAGHKGSPAANVGFVFMGMALWASVRALSR